MSINEHDFVNRIRQRRDELGLSQKDLANALGLDQGKISLIEKGARKIDVVKELPALAKILQKPISWFFDGSEAPRGQSAAEVVLKEYFPNIEFSDFEVKRLEGFLEPMVKIYMNQDPDLSKKASNQ